MKLFAMIAVFVGAALLAVPASAEGRHHGHWHSDRSVVVEQNPLGVAVQLMLLGQLMQQPKEEPSYARPYQEPYEPKLRLAPPLK